MPRSGRARARSRPAYAPRPPGPCPWRTSSEPRAPAARQPPSRTLRWPRDAPTPALVDAGREAGPAAPARPARLTGADRPDRLDRPGSGRGQPRPPRRVARGTVRSAPLCGPKRPYPANHPYHPENGRQRRFWPAQRPRPPARDRPAPPASAAIDVVRWQGTQGTQGTGGTARAPTPAVVVKSRTSEHFPYQSSLDPVDSVYPAAKLIYPVDPMSMSRWSPWAIDRRHYPLTNRSVSAPQSAERGPAFMNPYPRRLRMPTARTTG